MAVSAIANAVRHLVTSGNNRLLNEAAISLSAIKGRGKAKDAARAAFTAAVNSIEGVSYSAGSITDKRAKKNAGPEAGDAAAKVAAAAFADAYSASWLGAEAAAADAAAARKAVRKVALDTARADAVDAASVAGVADAGVLRALSNMSDEMLRAACKSDEASATRIVTVLSAALAAAKAERIADDTAVKAGRLAAQQACTYDNAKHATRPPVFNSTESDTL